jgi:glyoxylase-like metal-dependent hydrolase (beta-lactamase superfamily II)
VWPGAARITTGLLDSGDLPLPVTPAAGWEVLALRGRLGVYSSRERVLFCGDVLCEPGLGVPALAGGSQDYIDSLAAIEPLNAKLVVPWRGSAARGKRAIRDRIENDRSYIYSLHRHVLTSMVSGVTLERVLQVAADIYSDFPFLSAHLSNIRSVWNEMSNSEDPKVSGSAG